MEDLRIPDCSFDNIRQEPCRQPLVGHRQPSLDEGAINATSINAAAQVFTNPSFQAHINSLQNGNPEVVSRDVDSGLRQIFLGMSTLFRALATPGDGAENQHGQDRSSYGISGLVVGCVLILELNLLNNQQESEPRSREDSDLTSSLNALQTLLTADVSELETAAAATTTNGVSSQNKEYTPHPRIAAEALNFSKRTDDERTLLIECIPIIVSFLILQV